MAKQAGLTEIIASEIRKRGPITFRDFMEMALYHPGLGYYTSGKTRIGRSGDYYTSPHTSTVFGRMVAVQLKEMWQELSGGAFTAVEMGAGGKVLAEDIEQYLKTKEPEFFGNLRYMAVERGEPLPSVEQGCFLSNELVDAFPVHRVRGGGLQELYVGLEDGRFVEVWGDVSTAQIGRYFEELEVALPTGMVAEVNLEATRWVAEVAGKLKRGFVLTVDYGYLSEELYQPYRAGGTLLCYYRHSVSDDPYRHIGEQDMTSHVNFSSLIRWGEKAGLEVVDFLDQAHWLIKLGIFDQPAEAALAVKTLIMPEGMGTTFKVLIQTK